MRNQRENLFSIEKELRALYMVKLYVEVLNVATFFLVSKTTGFISYQRLLVKNKKKNDVEKVEVGAPGWPSWLSIQCQLRS